MPLKVIIKLSVTPISYLSMPTICFYFHSTNLIYNISWRLYGLEPASIPRFILLCKTPSKKSTLLKKLLQFEYHLNTYPHLSLNSLISSTCLILSFGVSNINGISFNCGVCINSSNCSLVM